MLHSQPRKKKKKKEKKKKRKKAPVENRAGRRPSAPPEFRRPLGSLPADTPCQGHELPALFGGPRPSATRPTKMSRRGRGSRLPVPFFENEDKSAKNNQNIFPMKIEREAPVGLPGVPAYLGLAAR